MTANSLVPITAWTRFRIPLEFDIRNIEPNSEQGEKWASIFSPLVKAPGHSRSFWGRVQDDPETVLLYTLWASRNALAGFEASSAHSDLVTALESLTDPKPAITTIIASFANALTNQELRPYTQLRYVYFPAPVSPSSRTYIETIQGPAYSHGVGISASTATKFQSAYHSRPTRGWVDGIKIFDRKECDVLMWLMFWNGKEDKKEFLENTKVMKTRPGIKPGTALYESVVGVLENWEFKLREQGALGWIDEYVDFDGIPVQKPTLQ